MVHDHGPRDYEPARVLPQWILSLCARAQRERDAHALALDRARRDSLCSLGAPIPFKSTCPRRGWRAKFAAVERAEVPWTEGPLADRVHVPSRSLVSFGLVWSRLPPLRAALLPDLPVVHIRALESSFLRDAALRYPRRHLLRLQSS
eukprot:SAG11_NODE_459_length_9261_cov_7.747463_7_plen_147_part_00